MALPSLRLKLHNDFSFSSHFPPRRNKKRSNINAAWHNILNRNLRFSNSHVPIRKKDDFSRPKECLIIRTVFTMYWLLFVFHIDENQFQRNFLCCYSFSQNPLRTGLEHDQHNLYCLFTNHVSQQFLIENRVFGVCRFIRILFRTFNGQQFVYLGWSLFTFSSACCYFQCYFYCAYF